MNEWISIKDALPKEDEEVLCFMASHRCEKKIRILNFYSYKWMDKGIEKSELMFRDGCYSWRIYDVNYWMPLPKAPNE